MRANPTGCEVSARMTRRCNSRLAGVWPVPAIIAAQMSQPIPRVTMLSAPSRR